MIYAATSCNRYSLAFTLDPLRFCSNSMVRSGNRLIKCSSITTSILGYKDDVVVGCSNGTIAIYKLNDTSHAMGCNERSCQTLEASYDNYLVSSDSSSNIMIWKDVDGSFSHVQTIKLKSHHALSLVFILFAGMTDNKIHVFVEKEGQFEKTLELKGHSDWVRSIDVTVSTQSTSSFSKGDLLIASASQDKYIRIWKVGVSTLKEDSFDVLKQIELGEGIEDLELNDVKLSTKAHVINVNGVDYSILLDAVLLGHDDWVHCVSWQPAISIEKEGKRESFQPLVLVSASSDKTILVWMPDSSEAWVPKCRVGDLGGSTLGFYGARLNSAGDRLVANGYHGSIHEWDTIRMNEGIITPVVGKSGHTKSVEDLSWDPSGSYLLSCSLDQTVRAHAEWKTGRSWHEIARTQIHGYDLHSLSFVDKYTYVSGSDEKVVRVFSAPRAFAETLENITGQTEDPQLMECRPSGANLPALGLSNKAVFGASEVDSYAAPVTVYGLAQPPFEEQLLTSTLWPELDKLYKSYNISYGHGYEIVCVRANKQGTLIATSSKASKAEHASIRLWDTETRKEICSPLTFHALTVTAMAFSNSGHYLLSAGRDRGFALFDLQQTQWKIKISMKKAHARIIWKCAFSPDDDYFVTASRDKTIKVWRTESGELLHTLEFESSVTALDLSNKWLNGHSYIAVGLESGVLSCSEFGANGMIGTKKSVDERNCHAGAVKAVCWNGRLLASCGVDCSVRIFDLDEFE